MNAAAAQDRHFLNYAIALGRRGLGTTAPNPSVGALVVITKDDGTRVIVGEGTTAPGGRPHAETQALAMAGGAARRATLYVSLEPCSHHGKTPPCTDAIIAAGIARVVCELPDPDPRVSGNGFGVLVAAGIDVTRLDVTANAIMAHAGHIRSIRGGRPFVRLKTAVSQDGRIAAGDGAPTWVTSAQSRNRGHLMRAQADAILVGAGTLAADNPSLTCRLPGLVDRSPVPVLLDSRLRVAPTSRIVREGLRRPIVCTAPGPQDDTLDLVAVEVMANGQLDPQHVLLHLRSRGITRVLIEGGPTVAQSFMDADIVDEVVVFRGAEHFGDRGLLPFVDSGIERVGDNPDWAEVGAYSIGPDTMIVYRKTDLTEDLMGR